MKQLENTWLIQRLNAPLVEKQVLAENVAFGGGLKNGGLSADAMKLLRPIFSFDYMGSSEFEWGAVPECLDRIAKSVDSYTTWVEVINTANVFIIGPKKLKEQITDRLWDIARYKRDFKENPHFKESLAEEKYYARTKGWLELDNNFFFFKDETMFKETAALFGIKIIED